MSEDEDRFDVETSEVESSRLADGVGGSDGDAPVLVEGAAEQSARLQTMKDGRYVLHEVLGEGSMGMTYLASDMENERLVAVKALYPSRLAQWKDYELFEREASTLQRLTHAQIPRYVDAFQEGDSDQQSYVLVQTYVEGKTLRQVMAQNRRFTELEVLTFAIELLGILVYLQGLDVPVIHRDIKPENVIIRERDDKPVLIDFGAVREIVRLTMGGGSTVIGTFGYMPPEQLMGSPVPSTDIYALGIIMIEMLTRQIPRDLRGADTTRLIEGITARPDFLRVLSRMTAPLVEDRYASARVLLEDLERLKEGLAPSHVDKIEHAMKEREEDELVRLRRASSPGVSIGYASIGVLLVLSGLFAIGLVIWTLLTSVGAGMLLAGLASALGGAIALGLLISRYTLDAWEPPTDDWVRVVGEVKKVTQYQMPGISYLQVQYEFPIRSGVFEGQRSYYARDEDERIWRGRKVLVFYQPGNPQVHEVEDFLHSEEGQMMKLFRADVVHTPE